MIIRTIQKECSTPRCVATPQWRSIRLLLKADAMGFSFHITTIYAGVRLLMHYRNHFEAVYCIAGSGTIENVETGESHAVAPGVLYALDRHDRHVLCAEREMQLACVFNPPLSGHEVHDETGAYPIVAEDR